jgi:hypothetical protein
MLLQQLIPAFTPTSVIRKMATDKADKPKDQEDLGNVLYCKSENDDDILSW